MEWRLSHSLGWEIETRRVDEAGKVSRNCQVMGFASYTKDFCFCAVHCRRNTWKIPQGTSFITALVWLQRLGGMGMGLASGRPICRLFLQSGWGLRVRTVAINIRTEIWKRVQTELRQVRCHRDRKRKNVWFPHFWFGVVRVLLISISTERKTKNFYGWKIQIYFCIDFDLFRSNLKPERDCQAGNKCFMIKEWAAVKRGNGYCLRRLC